MRQGIHQSHEYDGTDVDGRDRWNEPGDTLAKKKFAISCRGGQQRFQTLFNLFPDDAIGGNRRGQECRNEDEEKGKGVD